MAPDTGTPQPAFDPDSPFRYVGGDPAVDFVNTVDWTSRGLEADRLTGYGRLLEWALGAEVIDGASADRLGRLAAADPYAARAAVHDAVALRAVLERILRALTSGADPARPIAELNDGMLRRAGSALAITTARDGSFTLGWPSLADSLRLPLVVTAWRAAALLASADVRRVRRCGGVDCGWYFVDRSRNGLRHWCEMETCGTKEKSRRRAARRARAT
jgi:predicted RNA-binding Zn ribbon-like protein